MTLKFTKSQQAVILFLLLLVVIAVLIHVNQKERKIKLSLATTIRVYESTKSLRLTDKVKWIWKCDQNIISQTNFAA